MQSASFRAIPDWRRSTFRRRATAIGLTLLAELLFLLVLLSLNPALLPKREIPAQPTLIDLRPDASPAPTPRPKAEAKAKASPATRPPVPLPLQPKPHVTLPSFIPMSATDLAAADISKLGSHAATGEASASASGPGEGPGGAHLYNAEWYVEPSNAQLATYLPATVDRGSWAEVACKTRDHFHVENCQPLGESPLGSGLARAIRLAAWQFLVRPPNIDGKPLVGSWVRIHISFTDKGDIAGG